MRAPMLSALVCAAVLACGPDVTTPNAGEPRFARGGGSGGKQPSTITLSGDIGPVLTAGGESVTATLAKSPFRNLTLSGVRLTIGHVAELSGDGQRCRELMPARTIVPTGDDRQWDSGVRGDWVGDLTIWQGSQTSQSSMKFAGTRAADPASAVQFTVNSTNAVQRTDGTTTTLTFVDAPLGFGDGPGRVVPRDDDGLPIIYCVNAEVKAEQ
jgi:hypothetical protein